MPRPGWSRLRPGEDSTRPRRWTQPEQPLTARAPPPLQALGRHLFRFHRRRRRRDGSLIDGCDSRRSRPGGANGFDHKRRVRLGNRRWRRHGGDRCFSGGGGRFRGRRHRFVGRRCGRRARRRRGGGNRGGRDFGRHRRRPRCLRRQVLHLDHHIIAQDHTLPCKKQHFATSRRNVALGFSKLRSTCWRKAPISDGCFGSAAGRVIKAIATPHARRPMARMGAYSGKFLRQEKPHSNVELEVARGPKTGAGALHHPRPKHLEVTALQTI